MTSRLNVSGHIAVQSGGKITMGKNAEINVGKDFINAGTVTLGESEVFEAFNEAMKTSRSVAEFGTQLLTKLNIIKHFIP